MKDDWECNLNLLQMHTPSSINIEQILEMFVKKILQFLVFSET